MKKNKMMRVASILLVAVLLTTSIISGTFAKYVTSDSAADSARVAKFGVLVSASGDLFSETYYKVGQAETGNQPGGSTLDENLGEAEAPKDLTVLSVESANTGTGDNVVAPGTESTGDGLVISISGTPEVDVNVKLNFDNSSDIFLGEEEGLPDMTKADYTDTFDTEEYHPLVFTLTGDYLKDADLDDLADETSLDITQQDSGIVSGTLAEIKAVFNALNNEGEGIFVDANTDLSDVSAGGIGTLKLTWKWAFYVDEDTDKADTLLGDIAAGTVVEFVDGEQDDVIELPEDYDNYSTEVGITFSVSVTQVD